MSAPRVADPCGDVLAGVRPWHVEAADNLPWLNALPEGCLSLVVTSPPYEAARRYGEAGFKLRGQAWVDWVAPRVVAMCRATAGLVCVNMAGQVRKGSHSTAGEWLVAPTSAAVTSLICYLARSDS